jgi:hypothetical protein
MMMMMMKPLASAWLYRQSLSEKRYVENLYTVNNTRQTDGADCRINNPSVSRRQHDPPSNHKIFSTDDEN